MAPSGKYTRKVAREAPNRPNPTVFPRHPNQLAPTNRKATPTPTPLTRAQIEYLVDKASAKTQQKNELADSEPWTAVPNPVPDTGIHAAAAHAVKSSDPSPSVSPSHTTLVPSLPSSSFSTVPLLLTIAPTKPVITPSTTALSTTTTAAKQSNNVSPLFPQHHLQTGTISLIAVAGAFLLLGFFVTIKLCVRPTRRPLPVPSRPILDDPFSEDDVFETKLEDSPVFGGKERLSERPGNSGLWNWTQYPTPATVTVPPSTGYGGDNEKSHHRTVDSVGVPSTQTPVNSSYPAPMQQVHSAFTRAASRLSMASASMYPASPANNQNYGVVTSFTADGHPVMERVNPKVLQRSRSSTVGERNRDRPQSRTTRYSYGFAYDGAEVMSPQMSTARSPTIPITPAMPGRTRIKSSYYAHPRTSAMPPSQSTRGDVRQDNSHHKSESRTERDTEGSASGLGFGSPATVYPSSPQPTLYPDDSLSVVDAKRALKRVHKKPAPNNRASCVFGRDEDRLPPATSPTLDATAALGSLMLMDFGGQSAVNLNLPSASSATITPKKTASRSDDKPPRVPSPPPLPSLAQMALENANPEAYAEYRSPTYSIYGLYEGDRKSRVQN
ncbi:hypothetical protein B0H11DRAFT_2083546 [Mycena galericulata]|nr:hypothetical protein B0H11DRAFT_2134688 [Mycena galericulata]KAJ7446830.1 hypothetical protein B0H11DRAFT_2083546 [Mycena galericulata]